jgi:AAA+ ATPase superfamily predicted ATPase
MVTIAKPAALFDREHEWGDLDGFSDGPIDARRIGVVYGRRRFGKSFLLEHLALATGGFYYQALEETRVSSLDRFAKRVATYAGIDGLPVGAFADWPAAIAAVARAAAGRPVVVDEFPYLLHESPEVSSAIEDAYDRVATGRHDGLKLIICGSALSVMTDVLTGMKALRGRATLDMPITAFDYRQARSFWGIADVQTAFLVDSIVGGAPAYRDLARSIPTGANDIPDWLAATVLNPSHALFREAEYLLTEDPTLVDRALYRSIIEAIIGGVSTRRGVGNRLGRPDTALDHPLNQLERAGFIVRDADLLRSNRPLLRVNDPVLRFHFTVVRPDLARFEARKTAEAWLEAEPRFASQVVGPHFEAIARRWTAQYASRRTLGGMAKRVGFVQANDPGLKTAYEIDVVAEAAGQKNHDRTRLLAIGEAKGSERPRGLEDLRRLDRLRSELGKRADTGRTKLLLFGRSGFESDLLDEARLRPDVELVDLERLYNGD